MKRLIFVLLFLTAQLLVAEDYHKNTVLFCLQKDLPYLTIGNSGGRVQTNIDQLNSILEKHNVVELEKWLTSADETDVVGEIDLSRVYRAVMLHEKSWDQLQGVIRDFEVLSQVHLANPESIHRLAADPQNDPYTPNDDRYDEQWWLTKIMADYAWGLWSPATPGDNTVLVGVVDTGVDYLHPDLADALYINPGEDVNGDNQITAADDNGVDDDGNGYIDDYRGWDFGGASSGSPDDNDVRPPDAGPDQELSHGTHCAGIMAASTDNSTGVAGVSFRAKVVVSKNAADDDLTQPGIISGYDGILYCAKVGAKIINCSWGGSFLFPTDRAVLDDVSDNYGAIVVGAAGNEDSDNDSSPHYPSDYSKCISVSALTNTDTKSYYSNYGSSVDISAPGGEGSSPSTAILSTIHANAGSYAAWQGTSMASPVVAGAFALLKAWFPSKNRQWLIDELLAHADPVDDNNPSYSGELGSGRVNVYNSIARNAYPHLTIDNSEYTVISDNGDGQLNPGESARLTITLANDPMYLDAEDITLTISSTSSYISFGDDNAAVADINAGSTGSNSGDQLQFTLSADAPLQAIPITVTISANSTSAYPYENDEQIEVQGSMNQTGFPVAKTIIEEPVVLANVTGDSDPEVVVVGQDDSLYVYSNDGSLVSGFPVNLESWTSMGASIADVDNDGVNEIVVAKRQSSILKIIEGDGSVVLTHTVGEENRGDISIANMDSDPQLEMVFGTMSRKIHVLNIDGTELDGFPITFPSPIDMGVALGDLNGDDVPEMVFGLFNTDLYAMQTDGSYLSGFPVNLSSRVSSTPLIADLEGTIHLIVSTNDRKLQRLDTDGNILMQYSMDGLVKSAPALCDVNNDGGLDIVFGCEDQTFHVINFGGDTLAPFPLTLDGAVITSPVFADLDNDDNYEMVISTSAGKVYAFRNDGSYYNNFPASFGTAQDGSGVLSDMDNDGDFEFIVGGDDGLNVIDIKGTKGSQTGVWQTYLANTSRTGYYYWESDPSAVESAGRLPQSHSLAQNYPNPFNPETTIHYNLAEKSNIELSVFNLLGQKVKTLVKGEKPQGSFTVSWNGKNNRGFQAVSGIYIYELKVKSTNGTASVLNKKMILLR